MNQESPYARLPPDGFEPSLYTEADDYPDRFEDAPSVEDVFRAPEPDVVEAGSASRAPAEPVVEITHLMGGVVHEPFVLRASTQSYRTDDGELSVHVGLGGGAITLDAGVEGTVRRRGLAEAEEAVAGPTTVVLAPTDAARFERGDSIYFVRAYRPRPPRRIVIPAAEKARIALTVVASILLALAMHGLYGQGIVTVGSMAEAELTVAEPERERFADVRTLKAKVEELEKKRPEPKPLPKPKVRPRVKPAPQAVAVAAPEPLPEEPPAVPKAAQSEVAQRVAQARVGKSKARALADTLTGGGNPSKPRDTLGALGGIDVEAPSGGAGTAVPALGSPGGGAEGAIGGDLGGSGGPVTKGRAAAGDAGKVKARARKRKVRGKVRSMKSLARVQGQIDKAAVFAAINKASRRVQACYERALLKKPTLSGRISFSWTITSSGSASGVRVRSSTIADSGVSKCIMGVLRKLRFPKPKGGSVTISFPFVFKAAD